MARLAVWIRDAHQVCSLEREDETTAQTVLLDEPVGGDHLAMHL